MFLQRARGMSFAFVCFTVVILLLTATMAFAPAKANAGEIARQDYAPRTSHTFKDSSSVSRFLSHPEEKSASYSGLNSYDVSNFHTGSRQKNQLEKSAQQVVLIGFSGITWNEISKEDTPNLYAFAQSHAAANTVVRAVKETTCPLEGWLMLGAGQRVIDPRRNCVVPGVDTAGKIAEWNTLKKINAAHSYAAKLGTLGDEIKKQGISTLAIGPGAATALADSTGVVSGEYKATSVLKGSADESSAPSSNSAFADSAAQTPAQAYTQSGKTADLTFIDLGAVRYPDALLTRKESDKAEKQNIWERARANFSSLEQAPEEVREQIKEVDRQFGEILKNIPEKTQVIVASVGDSQNRVTQLGYFAFGEYSKDSWLRLAKENKGEKIDSAQEAAVSTIPYLAYSHTTRQEGLIQLTDIFPTLVEKLGLDGNKNFSSLSSPLTSLQWKGDTTLKLAGDYQRSAVARSLVGPFYIVCTFLWWAVIFLFFMRKRLKNKDFFLQISTWAASIPVASLLVNIIPWWRGSSAVGTLIAGIVLIAALIAGCALLARKRWKYGHIAVVAGFTTITACLDVLLDPFLRGFPLQMSSILGTQAQVGARFYGFSNATFAMFTTGLLLLLAVSCNALRESYRTTSKSSVYTEKQEDICDGASVKTAEFENSAQQVLQSETSPRHDSSLRNETSPRHDSSSRSGSSLRNEISSQSGVVGMKRTGTWINLALILGLGLCAVVIDGSSALGADFGGPPVIVVGIGILAMIYAGVRVTVPRVFGVVVLALAVSFVFAYIDFLHPPTRRSHLGRFVQSIADGEAWGVVTRKISQVGFGLPWFAVILLGLLVLAVLMWLWQAKGWGAKVYSWIGDIRYISAVRSSALALGLALSVGMLINDSGLVVPAVGAMVAVPLYLVEILWSEKNGE